MDIERLADGRSAAERAAGCRVEGRGGSAGELDGVFNSGGEFV